MVLVWVVVLSGLGACSRDEGEEKEPTATRGPLVVVSTREYASLVDTLAHEFSRQYPAVEPTVIPATTREAIVALLNDSVSTIFTDRGLNTEEQAVANEAGIRVNTTRVAIDALVAVVNKRNTVPKFTRRMLADIVTGEATRWSQVRGAGRTDAVEFVTTDRNSGVYEVIQNIVVGAPAQLSVFAAGESQRECVRYVARSERGVTLVSLTAIRGLTDAVRVVPVESAVDSAGTVFADILPTQTTVYTGEYGLRYDLILVTSERRSLTGAGFATFLLTTLSQKLVQNTGLVPEIPAARVIQLSSE
jgi:phosphate transport system substrate-binding protein